MEDKLYRAVTKENAHLNEKKREDGSFAALQFADNNNKFLGPLHLVEVDPAEYTRYVYAENPERGLGQAIVEDALIPAATEVLIIVLTNAIEYGVYKGSRVVSQTVVPGIKARGQKLFGRMFKSRGRKISEKEERQEEIQPVV